MFRPVPNVVLVKMIYAIAGGPPVHNDFYVRDTVVGWTTAKLNALVDDFIAWHAADVRPLQTVECVLTEVAARDIGAQFGAKYTESVGAAGTRAGTPLPAFCAAITRFLGDPGNPPAEGKVFHPGAAEADADANLFTQGYVDAVEAAYETLRGGPGFSGSEALVIVSRYSGTTLTDTTHGQTVLKPTPRAEGVSNTIANVTVPRRIGVVKSRRPAPL